MVDGNYANRGAMSAVGLFVIMSNVFLFFGIPYALICRFYLNPEWDRHDEGSLLFTFGLLMIMCIGIFIGVISFNRRIGEWFRYTHYPIRLNRKNRKVYVFRGDGTVLETAWDKAYFTLNINKQVAGINWFGIVGLVLKDPQTIQEQFTFGYSSSNQSYCYRHWEFMRRYMEEGPQAVMHADGVGYCLPIADKKETPYQGWIQLLSNDATSPIARWLMLPVSMLFFIGRLIANATCKAPLWPSDVEAACRVCADDPYVRDSSTNPKGYR